MAGLIVPLLAGSVLSVPVLGQNIASVDVAVVTGPGAAVYELFLAPDGWVEDCRVLQSDYSAENNVRVCGELVQMQARTPALGPDGKPIHSTTVVSRQRGGGEAIRPAEIEVEVAALPGVAGGRKAVGLAVLVDEAGRMRDCQPSSGAADAFSRVGCDQAKGLRFAAREDRRGRHVPYIAQITIDFVVDGTSS
ncbi:MAG TPA: hypothetical protein VI168_18055 [Croceibacterium sp.]